MLSQSCAAWQHHLERRHLHTVICGSLGPDFLGEASQRDFRNECARPPRCCRHPVARQEPTRRERLRRCRPTSGTFPRVLAVGMPDKLTCCSLRALPQPEPRALPSPRRQVSSYLALAHHVGAGAAASAATSPHHEQTSLFAAAAASESHRQAQGKGGVRGVYSHPGSAHLRMHLHMCMRLHMHRSGCAFPFLFHFFPFARARTASLRDPLSAATRGRLTPAQ